jgi:hypothetical protein
MLDTATGTTTLTVTELGANRVSYYIDSLSFDPSGQKLICVDPTLGMAHIIDARTGVTQKSRLVASAGHSQCLGAWSPDGATIALWFYQETTIILLDG